MVWKELVPCRSCGKEIKFIQTPRKKWLPVNPEGYELPLKLNGKILVLENGVVLSDEHNKITAYEAHWATCPGAEEYRKKRAEKAAKAAPAEPIKDEDLPF